MGSVWSILRDRVRKPSLDPRWLERVRRQYDVDAGYAAYHSFCRSRFTGATGGDPSPLLEKGREIVSVLDGCAAQAIERDVEALFRSRSLASKARHLEHFDIDDPKWSRDLLERVLSAEVDERATGFFGSEYLVLSFFLTRALPARDLGHNSFRWHCDRGPSGHLKLLLYLNGSEEHGGGTAFLDLETTRGLEASGYVFAPVKTRVADLAPLAERSGVPYAPWSPQMKPGDGILFQPADVLHRGISPGRRHRLVISACLLPSPIPRRDA